MCELLLFLFEISLHITLIYLYHQNQLINNSTVILDCVLGEIWADNYDVTFDQTLTDISISYLTFLSNFQIILLK